MVVGGWWNIAITIRTKFVVLKLKLNRKQKLLVKIWCEITQHFRVTVEGYKEIRTGARIFQYGPPSILDTSSSHSSAHLGGEAKLTCDSFAIPLPEKVSMK